MSGLLIIIQSRLGSSRLPRKVLLPFYNNEGILEILIKRLKNAGLLEHTALATTKELSDDAIVEIAEKYHCKVFRGDTNNVLKRFVDTAHHFSARKIIRICSDNPFIDISRIRNLIDSNISSDFDYGAYMISGKPSILTHYGFWAEYVTLDALKRVQELTIEPLYLEHVTNYIYTHPEIFKLNWLSEIPLPEGIRLTTDTLTDFELNKALYKELCAGGEEFGIEDVLKILETKPDVVEIMKREINANKK